MPGPYLSLDEPLTKESIPRRIHCNVLVLLLVSLGFATVLSLLPRTNGRDGADQEPAVTMINGHLSTSSRTNLRLPGAAGVSGVMRRQFVEPASGLQSRRPAGVWWPMRQASMTNNGRLGIPRAEFDHSALLGAGNNIQLPGEYPDVDFIEDVKKRFPDEGIADTFEARALLALGYTWVDVRTKIEYEDGHVPGSVNIPLIISTQRRFDSTVGDRVYKNQEPNEDFLKEVAKQFPDKNAKILIGCSDGRQRSIMALEALDEAGYTHIIGLKGGYLFFQTKYDGKLRRRREQKQVEVYSAPGTASGVHGVQAGNFEFKQVGMGARDKIHLRDSQTWIEFKGGSSVSDSGPSPGPAPAAAIAPAPAPAPAAASSSSSSGDSWNSW